MESTNDNRGRLIERVVALAIILLLIILCGALGWQIARPQGDSGVRLIPQGDMTSEEAQALIDEQAESSRMTVSLSPSMRLRDDGSLRPNFIVEEPNNGLSERLEIEQGGQVVYSSGAVAPGYGIEWCQAPAARAGSAIATVHALDEQGRDKGNPVSVEIEIVRE